MTTLPTMTPARALELKAEAAALAVHERIKHTAALARVAQHAGFPSWQRLVYCAGGREALDAEKRANPSEAQLEHARRHLERLERFGPGRAGA